MTPEQEDALLAAAAAGVDDIVRDAFRALVADIAAGTPPRDAVAAAFEAFEGEFVGIMAQGLSAVLQTNIGAAAVLEMQVGPVRLSSKLYAQSQETASVVADIVERHVRGLQEARAVALDLYEGYGFRPRDAEPIKLSPSEPRLPRYLRAALLVDDGVRDGFAREFARIQASDLKTDALRAAYSELIDALDEVERGAADALLERRLRVAFDERMRYFAKRIAETELHRAYSLREAQLLLDDTDVDFVQLRRVPGGEPCICALMTGRDLYGLGPGVYPKRDAPVPPFHPFCRCKMAPRLDLTGRRVGEADEDADRYFLERLNASTAARIVGSRAKLDLVLSGGRSPVDLANATRNQAYRIATAGQVAASTS